MDVDPSLPEYTMLQERECRELLQLLDQMGIATAERVYGPGDAVYREGEYGDALYVLTSGVLKLFRPYSGSKEATLRLLKPWDIFGHLAFAGEARQRAYAEDRKSTRLNSSHANISYAVFCLKKKKSRTSLDEINLIFFSFFSHPSEYLL